MDTRGRKEYVQVLRSLETFGQEEVAVAVEDSLRLSAISFDAVKNLVLAKVERRAPPTWICLPIPICRRPMWA